MIILIIITRDETKYRVDVLKIKKKTTSNKTIYFISENIALANEYFFLI